MFSDVPRSIYGVHAEHGDIHDRPPLPDQRDVTAASGTLYASPTHVPRSHPIVTTHPRPPPRSRITQASQGTLIRVRTQGMPHPRAHRDTDRPPRSHSQHVYAGNAPRSAGRPLDLMHTRPRPSNTHLHEGPLRRHARVLALDDALSPRPDPVPRNPYDSEAQRRASAHGA